MWVSLVVCVWLHVWGSCVCVYVRVCVCVRVSIGMGPGRKSGILVEHSDQTQNRKPGKNKKINKIEKVGRNDNKRNKRK